MTLRSGGFKTYLSGTERFEAPVVAAPVPAELRYDRGWVVPVKGRHAEAVSAGAFLSEETRQMSEEEIAEKLEARCWIRRREGGLA